jgi:hypothetical protein
MFDKKQIAILSGQYQAVFNTEAGLAVKRDLKKILGGGQQINIALPHHELAASAAMRNIWEYIDALSTIK